jgi:hypothetical protein
MKETLEERKPYWDLVDAKAKQNNTIDLDAYAKGVQDGAKWQQERSYSEEEVLKLLYELHLIHNLDSDMTFMKVDEWFEQFKNK